MTTDPHLGQYGLRMHGKTGISRAIEVVTDSQTHHVVVGIGGGLVASAEPWRGVVIRPETDYPDLVWSQFDWTEAQAFEIAWEAQVREGTRYNYLAFLSMGLFGLFGYAAPGWLARINNASKRVDCSELVVECFAGVTNLFANPAWMAVPGDLEAYSRMRGWDMTPTPTAQLRKPIDY